MNNINEYIKTFPINVQKILKKIQSLIQELVPEAEEAISYGMPTFKLNGKNLVHFAGWEKHVGFYPTPNGIEKFKKELAKYKGAKGSVQFSLNEPIPYALIKKIVKFRVKENLKRK